MRRLAPCLLLALLGACATLSPQGRTPFQTSPAMAVVLAERQAMHAKDLAGLTPDSARQVPSLIDATHAIPNVRGLPAISTDVPQVRYLDASAATGSRPATLFRPELARDTPIIIYFTGGTWVTGRLDAYEETARQLATRTGYVVLLLDTRRAPEAAFPGIHDDAYAMYQWARAHMREWGADPTRVALAGEAIGANLALSVAMQARDEATRGGRVAPPDALVLVTPWAGTALDTSSMRENSSSEPLTRATVDWAQNNYAQDSKDLRNPRLDLAARTDFGNLPPTTVVLAPIDPMRSSGEAVAAKLSAAGVRTEARLFPGTTQDFFGLGTQVPEAAAAEDYVATRLKTLFYRAPDPVPTPPRAVRTRRHR